MIRVDSASRIHRNLRFGLQESAEIICLKYWHIRLLCMFSGFVVRIKKTPLPPRLSQWQDGCHPAGGDWNVARLRFDFDIPELEDQAYRDFIQRMIFLKSNEVELSGDSFGNSTGTLLGKVLSILCLGLHRRRCRHMTHVC